MAMFRYAVAGALACAATATGASAANYLYVAPAAYNGFTSVDGGAYVGHTGVQTKIDNVGQYATDFYTFVNGTAQSPVLHTTTYMSAIEYDISALPRNATVTTAFFISSYSLPPLQQSNEPNASRNQGAHLSITYDLVTPTGGSSGTDPSSVPAVPEAATWGMMILGFGAIGLVMRRRTRASETRFSDRLRRIAAGEIA